MSAAPLAVVVGGGNGIGAATARLMAERGWTLAVADRDLEAAQNVAAEIGGAGYRADVCEEADLDRLAEDVETAQGPVSSLVVAAAAFQDIVPTENLETEVWERFLRTNLTGTFLACRIFGKRMLRRRKGSIVTIASIAALGSMPAEAYGTSKAGVVHLTKNLAGEWGRSGIRINCVSPGSTLVPRVAERLKTKRYAADPGDFTALGRIVQPNEVAEAIEFLASERASAITGVNLVVDAGWEIAQTWSQFGGVRPARAPE